MISGRIVHPGRKYKYEIDHTTRLDASVNIRTISVERTLINAITGQPADYECPTVQYQESHTTGVKLTDMYM
jgi:hypothetical protein